MGDWIEAGELSEFEETDRKQVDLGDGKLVGVFKLDDEFYCVSAWCSHMRANMMHGDVIDDELICPLHGARFDLRTGKNLSLPAVQPIDSYEVKVEDGKIYIHI